MNTACYCRTAAQNEASLQDQLSNIKKVCVRMDFPSPIIFQDENASGLDNSRPGYLSMLAAAENKSFNVLIVSDLNRLSRDSIELIQVMRHLVSLNILIICAFNGTEISNIRELKSETYADLFAKMDKNIVRNFRQMTRKKS